MSYQKVLLLQGPLDSNGVDPVVQFLDLADRPQILYNCENNIKYMSMAFRSKGFKVCYSGWSEDREWLEANRQLFDYLVISDQSRLRTNSIRNGVYLNNNKEKMYFAAQEGLLAIAQDCGEDALVFRIRSDVSINQELIILEAGKIQKGSKIILVEYLFADKILTLPDFMLMAEISVMRRIYSDLYNRSVTNTSYHLSSHVDHGIEYVKLKQIGVISQIVCMSKACYDSTVWRGTPRYFEYIFPKVHNNHFFDGMMNVPENFDIEAVIANIPKAVAGPEP